MSPEAGLLLATLPASRGRALTRAVVWAVPTAILAVATISIYGKLNFVPSGVSNRFVDYAVALIALPLPVITLGTGLSTLRWLAFALWPQPLGIFAARNEITFRLGPFGTRTFDVGRLDVRYLYELSGDDEEAGFEAFLPEEQQHATMLPRMLHPDSKQPVQRLILHFSSGNELEAVGALRPAIDAWRAPLGA